MIHLKKYTAYALLAVLSLISSHSLAQPAVRLSSATANPGDEVEMAVHVQGLSQVTALQLNITLPQTLTYVEESGKLGAEVASANHQLQITQTDNQLKIYIFSLQLDALKNAQGQLLTFHLQVGNDPGTYQLSPSIVLSNTKGEKISATVTAGTFTVLGPKIQLSAKTFDFGGVPIRSTHSKTLIVSNTGNEPLTLTGAESSLSHLGIEGLPCTIQAGGQTELTINYTPIKAGEESATISIASNAANGLQTIKVEAQPYSVNTLQVKSVTTPDGKSIGISVEMENMGSIVAVQCSFDLPDALLYVDGSAKINANRSKGHMFSASIVNGKLNVFIHSVSNVAIPGESGELFSFNVQPNGGSGDYSLSPFDVILSNSDGINLLSGTTDAVVHIAAPKLEADAQFDFGRLPLEEKVSGSYPLKNVGEKSLTISRVEFDNPAFTTSASLPLTIEAGATSGLEIVYQAEQDGAFGGVMQVYSDDPDQRMLAVTLQGSAYYTNKISLSGDRVGNNENQYAMTLNLQNTLPVVALQADLHWISGMTANVDGITLSNRAGNHQVVLNKISDNTYRLFVYSTNNQIIAAGEGALLTLIYNKVSSSVNYWATTMTVDKVILSTPEGQNQSSASVATMKVVEQRKKGDVNGDGIISISDATAVVDYLLERHPANITLADADVDGNGTVTIHDVVETIQLILTNKE